MDSHIIGELLGLYCDRESESSRARVDYYLSAQDRPPKDPPGVLFCLGGLPLFGVRQDALPNKRIHHSIGGLAGRSSISSNRSHPGGG